MRFNSADRNPTKNHDDNHGYEPGDLWHNKETGHVFLCIEADRGAAVWQRITYGPLHRVAETGSWKNLDDRPKLGGASELPVGEKKGTVAAGDAPRIKGALQADKNLGDLKSVDKAYRALGVSKELQRVLQLKTVALVLEALGLDDAMTLEEAGGLFQARSERLERFANLDVSNTGAAVIQAEDLEVIQARLKLRPGTHVQPFSKRLTELHSASEEAVRILTAPNASAILSILGVDDLVRDLRAELAALNKRINQLEKKK